MPETLRHPLDPERLPQSPATEILRAEVGSTVHGIGIGADDLDLMSVAIEPRASVSGLGQWDHWTFRTAEDGQRSQPGDIDWTVYGLRKYLRLVIKGNPSVLVPLYAPEESMLVTHTAGIGLINLREKLVSRACIPRFLGYLDGQRRRALEGKGSGHGNREGRREKWAAHMVRLGYQGLEMARTGGLTLPMNEVQAGICRRIKLGTIPFDRALELASELEEEIRCVPDSPLREEPDITAIEDWLHHVYGREYWL